MITHLFGSLVIGCIGLAVFLYGRKQQRYKAMMLGALLMACSYFVSKSPLVYIAAVMLFVALLVWRD